MKSLKKIILKLAKTFGYNLPIPVEDNVIESDTTFIEIYNKCKDYTMTPKIRMYALYKAINYVIKIVPGDFVECGVWRGGNIMLMAYTLLALKDTSRKIYLYDTFEGMPKPTNNDYSMQAAHNNTLSAITEWEKHQKAGHTDWCSASLAEVQNNVYSTEYPKDKFVFVKGKVENTIPKIVPQNICLLRLDTDWYESTKHELVHLFPLLEKNGVLIIDDYGYWAGSKKAVDEYFVDKHILLNKIDHAAVIGVKIQ